MILSPSPVQQFFGNNGRPLDGGLLFTYVAGTTTKIATYTDSTGNTANTNPIVLNFRGECNLWLDPGLTYKFVLSPRGDTDPPSNPIWTVDNITAVGTQQDIGAILWPKTVAESAAGVNISNYGYPPLNEFRYGFTGTGGAADIGARAAIVSVKDQLSYGNEWLNGLFVFGVTQTPSELAATLPPESQQFLAGDIRRQGAKFDNTTVDTTAFNQATTVAGQTINGAVGDVISLPLGTSILGAQVTLPNNVRFLGTNKNGSIFKASPSWNSGTSPYMMLATNGSSSMFDSILESVTIDAADIAGLGCIQSNAWQENCGLRRALLYRFRTYGLLFSQSGYATSGGAAFTTVSDTEIFGSTVAAATAGIKVEQISSAGTFVLNMQRCTIAGAPGFPLPRCIDIVNDSSNLDGTVHFENATTGLYIDGIGSHTVCNMTGDGTVTNVIEIAATFRGTLTVIACRRGSATNLIKDNRVGGLGNITDDIQFLSIGAGSAQPISNITQAASAVVTIAVGGAANPYVIGNQLTFSVVQGMTQINGLRGTVTAIGGVSGAWTVTVNINSSGFSAYTSGGAATLPANRGVSAVNVPIAWCVFDGTVAGTNGPTTGCNVKSITRNAAGDYSVNLTNALLNASAGLHVMTNLDTADGWWAANAGFGLGSANFTIRRGGAFAGGKVDASDITVIVYGLGT